MPNFKVIEDVREQKNNTLRKNTAVLEHQIEKKLIKTVGNVNCNGAPLTTTATTSSAKISVTSNTVGKSVVSSLSMSLERKDSIQYMPRKIAPYTIPAGQSTVIHLDNYTHFMAQRVTTTKAAFKRAEIISEDHSSNVVPSSTKRASSSSVGVGIVDVDLKFVLGGVNPSFHSNNNNFNMNKQKMQDLKPVTPSKIRGRKNSLALDYKKPKELKINLKKDTPDTSTPIKPVIKRTKRPARKKLLKPKQAKKSEIKLKIGAGQDTANEESDEEKLGKLQISPFTPSKADNKILRPCSYTLQSKKCLNEISCPYLHSDFPCKYYYLNIPCPQDFKCQFMHNGPLEPKLKDALRNHILDLLSTKPSSVETHFVQQIHYIDDLSHRLQSFQIVQDQTNEIIEVMDDADEERALVIDESSDDVNANNDTTNTNILSNISHDSVEIQPQYTIDKLDMIYEKFKETNYAVDEIDKKLKSLKTTLNISPNEKVHQLQIIYDLLKEQEKRLQIYENATSTTQEINVYDNRQTTALPLPLPSSNTIFEKSNIVLINPNIVSNKETSESEENVANLSEENSMATVEVETAMSTNLPVVEGTEFLVSEEENFVNLTDDEHNVNVYETENEYIQPTNSNVPKQIGIQYINEEEQNIGKMETNLLSNVPQESGIELISIEELPTVDLTSPNEMIVYTKDDDGNELNPSYNMNVERESNEAFDHTDLNETCERTEHNSDEIETLDNKNEHFDKTPSHLIDENNFKISDINNYGVVDKNETIKLNNNLILHNETPTIKKTNDETIVFENIIQETSPQEIEEQSPSFEKISPSKPERKNRIRLRSHRLQDNEDINQISCESQSSTTPERSKPIRTRRLRLPKPNQKPIEKSNIDECQINADIINKLIRSTEENTRKTLLLQDAETPIIKNVILTKRFLKKAKAKLDQQTQLNETDNDININANEEQDINDNKISNSIENIDVSLLTQTSDDNNSSHPLQHPLIIEGDFERMENVNSDLLPSSDESYDNLQKTVEMEMTKKQNIKPHISFEDPSSSLACMPYEHIKDKYNLGNPQVLLVKLKTPFLPKTTQNAIQADSTTSSVNPIVTSSLLSDEKISQKRRSLTDESDLDSSLSESKCLKLNNSKSVRKIKINYDEGQYLKENNDAKDEDLETDSSDEKLTSSYNSIQQQQDAFESSSIHQKEQHQKHANQTENEFDLHQQIESDLESQIQQQQQQQENVEKASKPTVTSYITKNGNNLSHKQYRQDENSMMEVVLTEKKDEQNLIAHKQYEENKAEEREIANSCNSYDNIEKDEDGRTQSVVFKRIHEPEKVTSDSSNKYSNEISATEEKTNDEYSTYSSLFNKLTDHSTKRQINFENSSVNITPISSPTHGNETTIASPSPIRKLIDLCMGGEIDGRLTYPPIPYILYEIDLGKIEVNKPLFIDRLKKTIQLDPRVFRTHVKKHSMTSFKTIDTNFNALVQMRTTSNNFNLSHDTSSSFMHSTTSMISPYDPRNRSSATMIEIERPSLPHQTALTPYNSLQTAVVPSSSPSSSASLLQTGVPNGLPLALQYHTPSQSIIQPQPQPQLQQQSPNMFIYGCLQRSPWYQSLMSTMKIQINQSISQLVRALNNYHRERVFNPEMVFDVFKIDCAGELLEIMRNLGIFVDANGIINEQRHTTSFAGHSCCNTAPVNAACSFIQQYLTPNTHCTALTTASSTYSAASGANPHCHLNVHEPFVSCYIKAPEPQQKHSNVCCAAAHHSHNDDNNSSNINSNNRNDNNRNDNNNDRYDNNSNNNNNNDRYDNNSNNNNNNNTYGGRRPFKKPYDNNDGNNSYQQRSNQRSSYNNNYNNNPRFMKPGACSPSKSNTSPSGSPKSGFEGGSRGGYGARGGRGGGGRFNNRRFNNNKDNNNDWGSSGSNDNSYNKYKNNNSPPRSSSPNSSFPSGSPRATDPPKPPAPAAQKSDEECWD